MDAFAVVIGLLAGAFCIFCSWKDYDWFFNNHRARPLVALFGREGARIFYYILGGILILISIMAAGAVPRG